MRRIPFPPRKAIKKPLKKIFFILHEKFQTIPICVFKGSLHEFNNKYRRFNDDRASRFDRQFRSFPLQSETKFLTMEFPELLKYSSGAESGIRMYGIGAFVRGRHVAAPRYICCTIGVAWLVCFVGSPSDRSQPYLLLDFEPLALDDQSVVPALRYSKHGIADSRKR